MKVNWITQIALVALLTMLSVGIASAQGRRSSEKDYSFKAREIESGKMLEFDELILDKPLILHVWAPDCPHCQRHMPYLSNLYKKLDLEKVNFVTYSVTGNSSDAQKFLQKRNLEFQTVCLSNGSFSKDLKDGGWPNTLVIGLDGKLVGSCDINGPSYVDTMVKLVEKAEAQYDERRRDEEAAEADGDEHVSWFED